jgi:hypothetical protein
VSEGDGTIFAATLVPCPLAVSPVTCIEARASTVGRQRSIACSIQRLDAASGAP